MQLTRAANGVDGELQLMKDDRITAAVSKQVWDTGGLEAEPEQYEPSFKKSPPKNAIVQIVDRAGRVLDAKQLERPLARIGTVQLYADERLTYLLTVDYSAGFGSYSGPMTFPVEVMDGHLRWLDAVEKGTGKRSRISVMQSPKTAWKIVDAAGGGKEILEAACRPDWSMKSDDFTITYRRYFFDGSKWVEVHRTKKGFTEFDEGFPSRGLFP